MMLVTTVARGESDTSPITRVFEYAESDKRVFLESVKMVRERVSKGLRININEALVLYVDLAVTNLAAGKTPDEIRVYASRLLSSEEVLIGVAEGLQNLTLTVTLDGHTEKVVLHTPIPVYNYTMSGRV